MNTLNEGTHNCHADAVCEKRGDFGFWCTCKKGFSGDGRRCYDFNECKESVTCKENSACVNTRGLKKIFEKNETIT